MNLQGYLKQQKFSRRRHVFTVLGKHVIYLTHIHRVISRGWLSVSKVCEIIEYALPGGGPISHNTASLIGMRLPVAAAGEAQNVDQCSISCRRFSKRSPRR